MQIMTISEVSRTFHVSTRLLRYYDEIGLLPSSRRMDYAYRVYDEEAVRRLQQIITLRKLRIPLKKIALLFVDKEQDKIVKILQESIVELDNEITAMNTIRDILRIFVSRLNENAGAKLDLLDDAEIIHAIETLSLSKINFKEDRSMDDLNKANETLSKLNDVRILHLPPCTVAASHFVGQNPELNSGNGLVDFLKKINLYAMKSDARVFGFNHPNPSQDRLDYGYEFWVSIPDDLNVPAPLVKKHFEGGLYAAHCIKMGDFHEWEWLCKWAENNSEYQPNYHMKGDELMGGCLEEHLNFVFDTMQDNNKWPGNDSQLDLLIPIKPR